MKQICRIILIALWLFSGATVASASPDFTCLDVIEVPAQECEALVVLYNSTNGPGWYRSENWLVTPAVDDWFGVTVSGGHVTGLPTQTPSWQVSCSVQEFQSLQNVPSGRGE